MSKIITIIGIIVSIMLFYVVFTQTDSTDRAWDDRSGMRLYVDEKTGCHYLGGFLRGLTPRLGADGKQICIGQEH